MKNIEDITGREQQLLSLVGNAAGTMEEKYSAIEDQGIFEAYKAIHLEYADLSSTDIEALKRALFLLWYVCAEPPCYTGINDLDPEAISKTMLTLNDYLLNDMADAELKWMLSYYFVWDFVFEKFIYLEAIAKLLNTPSAVNLPISIERTLMQKRGQMGKYWNSLSMFK